MLGTAESHVQAPLNDPNQEIWGCGEPSDYVTHAERWFDVHRLDGYSPEWQEGWRKAIADKKKVIKELWMFYPEPLGPKIIPFPIQDMINRFGSFFLTSSFAWMFCKCIDEMRPLQKNGLAKPVRNGDEISIYGVDMEYGGEYYEQRPGLQHFMDSAKQLGIKVEMLASSGIAYQPIPYPFWDDDPMLNKVRLRQRHYRGQQVEFQALVESTGKALERNEGALNELRNLKKAKPKSPMKYADKKIAAITKQNADFERASAQPKEALLRIEGCLQEIDWFENYIKP